MLSIDSIKGRSVVFYASVAVAVLLSVAAVVLAYDSSGAEGGGGNGNGTVREVVQYDGKSDMFIDKEGYNGGDAKLIYTLVSYKYGDGDKDVATGVKITDMERDPCGTSYTVFPDQVTYGNKNYLVFGNFVKKNDDNTFTDVEGDIKLNYTVSGNFATVSGFTYDKSEATSVTIPDRITFVEKEEVTEYKVNYKSSQISDTRISKVTIVVPSLTNIELIVLLKNCSNLQSLKVIYENDTLESGYPLPSFHINTCNSLTDLWLPNHMLESSISNCPNLGSKATSENPFIFNSNVTKSFLLSYCSGIKYLEFGQNVTQATLQYRYVLCECPNLEVIYNTSPNVTEDDIAKCIVQSGSNHVLLYNNPGGTFTKGATFTSKTDEETNITTISDITMPTGTYTFADSSGTEKTVGVAAWSHNSGASWYHAGYEYGTLTPWGSNQNDYSYYYYCMNSFSTVTYKVYYRDSTAATDKISEKTQTVPCMYNTHLYDNTTYPDDDAKSYLKSGLYWDYSTETAYNKTCRYGFGQSVTLTGDIDLCCYPGVYGAKMNFTFKWDYVNTATIPVSVTTYSYTPPPVSYGTESLVLPSESAFTAGAVDSSGTSMTSEAKAAFTGLTYWIANSGNAYAPSASVKLEGEMTFTAMLSPESCNEVRYQNYDSSEVRTFIATGDFTASTNLFWDSSKGFVGYWYVSGIGYAIYPGSVLSDTKSTDLFWNPTSDTLIKYWNYTGVDSDADTVSYTAGESKCLNNYTLEGYKLIGWSYKNYDSYKGTFFNTGNVNFSLDTAVTMYGCMGLYAIWEKLSEPTVITDNLLVSEENAKEGTYKVSHLFISPFTAGDDVRYTVTFYDSTGSKVVDKPTAVGVYVIKVGYQVFRGSTDVTDEYYSGYVKDTPVTYQCYNAFLTIYSGDYSTVID